MVTFDFEIVSLFSDAIDVLALKGYFEIKKVPLREYPKSKHLDSFEKKFASLETSCVFQTSSDPESIRQEILNSDLLKDLYNCFFLNRISSKNDFITILGDELFAGFIQHEFIVERPEGYKCLYRFVPVRDRIYVTSAFDRSLPHFTYLSYDSFVFKVLILKELVPLRGSIFILDYCCGVGYVGLEIKNLQDSLLGIDVNPNAVWMSNLNASLHKHRNAEFICSEEPPKDKFFDLIVCNPPFVFLPSNGPKKMDSYGGGEYGLELTLRFLKRLCKLLKPNGQGFMITTSPVISGEDYLLKVLNERFPDLYGKYYDLCDSLKNPEDWEQEYGIEVRKHVFFSFSRKHGRAGWDVSTSKGLERFRFAF